jgi:hypothetical protein
VEMVEVVEVLSLPKEFQWVCCSKPNHQKDTNF